MTESVTEPETPAVEPAADLEAVEPVLSAAGVESVEPGDETETGGADAGEAGPDEAGSDEPVAAAELDSAGELETEGEIAADYLEELLDIADLDGDIDMDVEGDRAAVSIVGGDISVLVGRSGEVLDALQELTRLAVYRETGERSRLMLDVGGFRADKRARLETLARETVEKVKETGEPIALDPMSPFERKVVHDAVAAGGLVSDSEGTEPRRYVVIRPAS